MLGSLALIAPATATPATAPGPADRDWRIEGRVQIDHSGFDGVYSRRGTRHAASYLRRASLGAALRWSAAWSAELEVEGDTGRVTLDTAFIGFALHERWEARLGRIDPDFGLEPSSSSAWTFGVERSAVWDLAPDVADALEGLGLRIDAHGPRWHTSLGAYDKGDHHAVAARAVMLPLQAARERLQLGASLARTQGLRGDGRIRTRLGVRGVTENDEGRRSTLGRALAADAFGSDTTLGLELAWQQGPWMLQAEVVQRQLAGRGGQADRQARGAYVLAAWSVTGEMRRHDAERGRFRGPRPAGAGGAWEVFYRLDRLQVNDGGSATVQTLGLAWTAKAPWRALLNLHRARSKDANARGDGSGNALSARWQASF